MLAAYVDATPGRSGEHALEYNCANIFKVWEE
jgi:hypothetical protein